MVNYPTTFTPARSTPTTPCIPGHEPPNAASPHIRSPSELSQNIADLEARLSAVIERAHGVATRPPTMMQDCDEEQPPGLDEPYQSTQETAVSALPPHSHRRPANLPIHDSVAQPCQAVLEGPTLSYLTEEP